MSIKDRLRVIPWMILTFGLMVCALMFFPPKVFPHPLLRQEICIEAVIWLVIPFLLAMATWLMSGMTTSPSLTALFYSVTISAFVAFDMNALIAVFTLLLPKKMTWSKTMTRLGRNRHTLFSLLVRLFLMQFCASLPGVSAMDFPPAAKSVKHTTMAAGMAAGMAVLGAGAVAEIINLCDSPRSNGDDVKIVPPPPRRSTPPKSAAQHLQLMLAEKGDLSTIKWNHIPATHLKKIKAKLEVALIEQPGALENFVLSKHFRSMPYTDKTFLLHKHQTAQCGMTVDCLTSSGKEPRPDWAETEAEEQQLDAAGLLATVLTTDDLFANIAMSTQDGYTVAHLDNDDTPFKVKQDPLLEVVKALQSFTTEVMCRIKNAQDVNEENPCTGTFLTKVMQGVINDKLKQQFHNDDLKPKLLEIFQQYAKDGNLLGKDLIPDEGSTLGCLVTIDKEDDEEDYIEDLDDEEDMDIMPGNDEASEPIDDSPKPATQNVCPFLKATLVKEDEQEDMEDMGDSSLPTDEQLMLTNDDWNLILQASIEKDNENLPVEVVQLVEHVPDYASYALCYARMVCGYTEDNDDFFQMIVSFMKAIADGCLEVNAEEDEETHTEMHIEYKCKKQTQDVQLFDPLIKYAANNPEFYGAHEATLAECAEKSTDLYRTMCTIEFGLVSEKPGMLGHLIAALSSQRKDASINGVEGVIPTYRKLTLTMMQLIRLLFVERVPHSLMKPFWKTFLDDLEKKVEEHSSLDTYENEKQLQATYGLALKTYLTCIAMFYNGEFDIRPGLLIPFDKNYSETDSQCPVKRMEFYFRQMLESKDMSTDKSLEKFNDQSPQEECQHCKNARKPVKDNAKPRNVASDDSDKANNNSHVMSTADMELLIEEALDEFVRLYLDICNFRKGENVFVTEDFLEFLQHVLAEFNPDFLRANVKKVCQQYCNTHCSRMQLGKKVDTPAAARIKANSALLTKHALGMKVTEMAEKVKANMHLDAEKKEEPTEEPEDVEIELTEEEQLANQLKEDRDRMFGMPLSNQNECIECNCKQPSERLLEAYYRQCCKFECDHCEGIFTNFDPKSPWHPDNTYSTHCDVVHPEKVYNRCYCEQCYFMPDLNKYIVPNPELQNSQQPDKADKRMDANDQHTADDDATIALIKEAMEHLLRVFVKEEMNNVNEAESNTNHQLVITLGELWFPTDDRIKNFLKVYFDGLKGDADNTGRYRFNSLPVWQGKNHSSCLDLCSEDGSVDDSMRTMYHRIIQAHIDDMQKLIYYDMSTRCPCCEAISFIWACSFGGIDYYAVKFTKHKEEFYCDGLFQQKIDTLLPRDMEHDKSVVQMPFLYSNPYLKEQESARRSKSVKPMLRFVYNYCKNRGKISERVNLLKAARDAESDPSPEEAMFTLALEVFGILSYSWDEHAVEVVLTTLAASLENGLIVDLPKGLECLTYDHVVCSQGCVNKLRADLQKLDNGLSSFVTYDEIFAPPKKVTRKSAQNKSDIKKNQADKKPTTKALETTNANKTRQKKQHEVKIDAQRKGLTEEVACTPGVMDDSGKKPGMREEILATLEESKTKCIFALSGYGLINADKAMELMSLMNDDPNAFIQKVNDLV